MRSVIRYLYVSMRPTPSNANQDSEDALTLPSSDSFGNSQSKFVKVPLQHTICALH